MSSFRAEAQDRLRALDGQAASSAVAESCALELEILRCRQQL
jgi:hypothetical protein